VTCETKKYNDKIQHSYETEEVVKTHATARLVFAFVLMLLVSSAFAAQSYKLSDSPSGVTLMSQDRDGLTLRLDVGELLFTPIETKEGSFTMLSIKDFTRSYNIGEPNLPMANRLISIPYGCELDVRVIDFESEEISLDSHSSTALPHMSSPVSMVCRWRKASSKA